MTTNSRIEALRQAIRNGEVTDIHSAARWLRSRYAPRRRFTQPVYISRNGSRRREYGDAFAEVLFGQEAFVTSHSAEYPPTKQALRAIEERIDDWADRLGLPVTS